MTEETNGPWDPNKYRFTRIFAGISLGAIIVIIGYILIIVVIKPDIAEAIGKVSGLITTVISGLILIVGAYMGISNKWGAK